MALLAVISAVDRKDTELRPFDFEPLAGLLDLLIGTEALDITEAIQATEVGVEVEVLEFPGVFGRQFEGFAAGCHAMDGMHVAQGPLQSQEVVG